MYYTLLSITALIGLFGTIARNINAISLATYAFFLAWSARMQIFIDVAYLVLFFGQFRETLIRNCIDGSTDKDTQNICNGSFNVPNVSKWTTLVSMIVGLIIQFRAADIVASYAEKLINEESWRFGPDVVPLSDTSGSKYTHMQQQDDHGADASLTNASYAYPYSDTSNSFGDSTPHHHTTTSV